VAIAAETAAAARFRCRSGILRYIGTPSHALGRPGRPAWQRAYTFTHAHIHTSKTRVHIPRVRRQSTAERLVAADRGVADESEDGSTDGQEERRWTRLVSGGVLHRSTVADSSFAWLVDEASLHLAVQRQPATTSSRQLTDALCCRMSVCYVQLYFTTQQYGSVATNKTEININIQFNHTRITHRRACMHAYYAIRFYSSAYSYQGSAR